jgi:malate dehydrogenase (oxaloacetate-decarboxylating)
MEITRRGSDLLEWPLENRGTAFTTEQRRRLGLLGLLPPNVETLNEQVQRSYEAYQTKTTDMGRHIFLRSLQDTNETLFYRLLSDHLIEMIPVIYTPVVGAACQRRAAFSLPTRNVTVLTKCSITPWCRTCVSLS